MSSRLSFQFFLLGTWEWVSLRIETVLTGLDKHTAASEGGESGQTGWGRIAPVKNGAHISNVSLWVEWHLRQQTIAWRKEALCPQFTVYQSFLMRKACWQAALPVMGRVSSVHGDNDSSVHGGMGWLYPRLGSYWAALSTVMSRLCPWWHGGWAALSMVVWDGSISGWVVTGLLCPQ